MYVTLRILEKRKVITKGTSEVRRLHSSAGLHDFLPVNQIANWRALLRLNTTLIILYWTTPSHRKMIQKFNRVVNQSTGDDGVLEEHRFSIGLNIVSDSKKIK